MALIDGRTAANVKQMSGGEREEKKKVTHIALHEDP